MIKQKITVTCGLLIVCVGTVVAQPSNLTISGSYGSSIRLSAGTPSAAGGRTANVTGANTQGTAIGSAQDSEDFTATIDFGDLAKGDGSPVTGVVGLRVRSNTSFKLTTSAVQFQTNGLRYVDKVIDNADGGSFIRVWTGPVSSTGNRAANAADISVNGSLVNGLQLSAISRGGATANSTTILSGQAASRDGSLQSSDNAIEVPLFVSVPSGYELGPAGNAAQGTFNFSMQFAAFGGP
jgi:hypothetical protein